MQSSKQLSSSSSTSDEAQTAEDKPLPGEPFCGAEGYKRIKTHFPSARIKKLMQSDEDIGKVAQATPVALGRALELFMSTLVEKSVETAKEEQSRKVNVKILKKTIESNENFDFIVGICDKYIKTNGRSR